jgi:osmotically-inducible protein OsmY
MEAVCGFCEARYPIPGMLDTVHKLAGRTANPFSFLATSDDTQVVTNIKAQMFSDSETRPALLQVTAKDGVVTLTGTVSSAAVRYKAFRIAEQTVGVSKVIDQMRIAH